MEFAKILLAEAREGMVLAEDILDRNGHLVFPSGSALNMDTIRKIDNFGIIVIKIQKEQNNADAYNESGEIAGYYEEIRQTDGFKQIYRQFQNSVDELATEFSDIVVHNKEIQVDRILLNIAKIIKANTTKFTIFEILDCVRGSDDQTFVHSMNVALICREIGAWFGYSNTQMRNLVMAGILHDIGKVKIPLNILNKPEKLTEQEYMVMKYHTVFGYKILKDQPIDTQIKYAVLMHHERYDGSGYPRGRKGNDIDEFARIIAIADVYDAMTAKRVYRERMSPFDVLEYFEQKMSLFDPEILPLFLKKTAESYVNNTVLLSNGEKAQISMINNNTLGRPIVITSTDVIDLSERTDIKIKSLL